MLSNKNGLACVISITEAEEVLFRTDRVEVFGQPDHAFKLDGTKFHDYRVVRDADSLTVLVDGRERIRTTKLGRSRGVGYGGDTTHFGTSYRAFRHPFGSQDHFRRRKVVGAGESVWQRVKISVENPNTCGDTWSWDAGRWSLPRPVPTRPDGGGEIPAATQRAGRPELGAVPRRRDPGSAQRRYGRGGAPALPHGLHPQTVHLRRTRGLTQVRQV